jgi:predicted metalloprotease
MKWEGREQSSNVEDRRGSPARVGMAVGGGGSLLLVILALLFGVDPQKLLNQAPPGQQGNQPRQIDPAEEKQAAFSRTIFRDTEIVWEDLFRKMGKRYEKPTLVLFSGRVESPTPPSDRSTVPATTACSSISRSTRTWSASSTPPASSRGPT